MTNDLPFDAERALNLARETFAIEAEALLGMQRRLTAEFPRAVETILRCDQRVVVMGMGKSGHVGRKIAATLASTGTPSLFVHPAEAAHGDLGMVTAGDVCLLISNSGESNELSAIIPALRRLGVTLVALTGRADSSLGKVCDIVLSCAVDKEACTLNLAPTASTAAQMAMGDALSVALLDARGFREEDFALSHPGGALGRKLLMHVSDLMRTGDGVPRVVRDASFSALLQEMSGKGLGLAAIVDGNTPVGIFTDGDLRRLIETGGDLRQRVAHDVMHPRPHLIRAGALAVDAADLMERHRVTSLLVVDNRGELVGALNTYDLLRAEGDLMAATPRSHLNFAPDVLLKAQGEGTGIKAAIFDVDGVLTDGTIWITEAGETLKNFNVLDGQGLLMLRKGGIVPIVITGRDSPAVRRRVGDLGLAHAAFGASDKVAAANEILQALGVDWGEVAVIGDDWPDLPLFANAGFACAPANAHAEALGAAHHVTVREGGRGAAREFCDLLLMANGLYLPLMTKLLVTLDSK